MNIKTDGWSKKHILFVAVSTGIDSMSLLYSLLNDYQHTYRKLHVFMLTTDCVNSHMKKKRFERVLPSTSY